MQDEKDLSIDCKEVFIKRSEADGNSSLEKGSNDINQSS